MNAHPAADPLLTSACAAVLAALPDAHAVYAFGSRIDGSANAESDLDLAVLPAAPLSPLVRYAMQRDIAARLGLDVDLVDLHAAGSVLRLEVVSRGRRLYHRDADRVLDFEARVLGEYAELMDATAELRAAVRERGRVYLR